MFCLSQLEGDNKPPHMLFSQFAFGFNVFRTAWAIPSHQKNENRVKRQVRKRKVNLKPLKYEFASDWVTHREIHETLCSENPSKRYRIWVSALILYTTIALYKRKTISVCSFFSLPVQVIYTAGEKPSEVTYWKMEVWIQFVFHLLRVHPCNVCYL